MEFNYVLCCTPGSLEVLRKVYNLFSFDDLSPGKSFSLGEKNEKQTHTDFAFEIQHSTQFPQSFKVRAIDAYKISLQVTVFQESILGQSTICLHTILISYLTVLDNLCYTKEWILNGWNFWDQIYFKTLRKSVLFCPRVRLVCICREHLCMLNIN